MKPSQQLQISNITNLLMQMLQNQQQQINQIMMTFMNFAHTSSPTPTSPAAPTTHTAPVSSPPMNNNSSYIKFLNLLLFNSNHNKYLVWKWKTLNKLLAENQKYVKMGIQADYLQQHYINSHLNNSTAAKVFLWLDLNSNASMEEFWAFMNSQFKNNQLAEWALSKLSSLRQKGEVWIYVQEFNQLTMKVNLISPLMSEMSDIHFGIKQMLFNRNLKDEIWTHVLLISRSTLFDEYTKQVQQTDNELYWWKLQRRAVHEGTQKTQYSAVTVTVSQSSDQMEWEPTSVTAVRASTWKQSWIN